MENLIVSEGHFTIPLYHGTSTLFLDSIISNGLGQSNPLDHLNAVSLLDDLVKIADKVLQKDEEWQAYRFQFEWMATQFVTAGNANFQHGHTYLTPAQHFGFRYALANRLGSELLSNCEVVWKLIRDRDPEAFQLPERIAEIFAGNYEPIVFTVSNVPVEAVLSEEGGPPYKNIKQLQEHKNMIDGWNDDHEIFLNLSFRLISPISRDSVSYELIDPEKGESFA